MALFLELENLLKMGILFKDDVSNFTGCCKLFAWNWKTSDEVGIQGGKNLLELCVVEYFFEGGKVVQECHVRFSTSFT
jgi:hypothetical protein